MSRMPWMDRAMLELGAGVREWKDGDNPRILWYGSFTRLKPTTDEVPWCSNFVTAMLETAGCESTRSAAARSYLNWGKACDGFPTGGIAVLGREDPKNPNAGHVGFIAASTTDKILLLGGNQQNRVSLDFRLKSEVLAVRWPHEYALPY